MPPVGVPSGMRTSETRGATGVADAGFVIVTGAAVVALRADALVAVGAGKPVVGLTPGGVSGSGAGSALTGAAGLRAPLRVVRPGRRFVLVETKPVLLAPDAGGLP